MDAAVKAVETVDTCMGRVYEAANKLPDTVLLVTADHGNADCMIADGKVNTAHTTNPVPFVLVNAAPEYRLAEGGKLCDIAPTLLELLGLPQPEEMTGKSLLVK